MALTFDETELEGRIQQLPSINRAAFAAALPWMNCALGPKPKPRNSFHYWILNVTA